MRSKNVTKINSVIIPELETALKRCSSGIWTPEELQILDRYKSLNIRLLLKYLPNKTYEQIKYRKYKIRGEKNYG